MSDASEYLHGSSPEEQARLSLLNDILNDACLKEMALQPGDSVLDLGCGTGQLTRLMARSIGEETSVVGVERDHQQFSQARKLAKAAGQAALVDFRLGDATEPPLSDNEWASFDVAHTRFLLEHAPKPELIVQQMARAVRPGGRVIIIDDDHGDFRPWPEPAGFKSLWRAYVGTFKSLGSDPYVGRRLISLLHGAGLTSLRNSCVFFGGCAGDGNFEATANNLIAAFSLAKEAMLSTNLVDAKTFDQGLKALEDWKDTPGSALWYSACYAEGKVPG